MRVTDPEQRQAIRVVAWDQTEITDASELMVLCFDQQSWQKDPQSGRP